MIGKRANLARAECAIARSLGEIGDWWSLLIMRDALAGVRRFGEFQKNLGLAKNILSARLRKLVELGILETVSSSDGSAYKEYAVTAKGEKLNVVIVALWQWGKECCLEPGEQTYDIVDKKSLKPLQKLELRARDGRILSPGEMGPLYPPAGKTKKKAERPSERTGLAARGR